MSQKYGAITEAIEYGRLLRKVLRFGHKLLQNITVNESAMLLHKLFE